MTERQNIAKFEEYDFYSESSHSHYDDLDSVTFQSESSETAEDFADKPTRSSEDQADSVLDTLLSEALSGNGGTRSDRSENLRTDFSHVYPSDTSDDSMIKSDNEANDSETPRKASIDEIIEQVRLEEEAVPVESLPDFTTSRHVYGTCFKLNSGKMVRPARFEFINKNFEWIEFAKKMLYNPQGIPFELFRRQNNGNYEPYLEFGKSIEVKNTEFIETQFKTANDMKIMQTLDIQKIICQSLNSNRLTVLFFGVDAEQKITGCPLTSQERDNFRIALDTAVQSGINPHIENVLDVINVQFLKVEKAPNKVPTFLVVVKIKQHRPNMNYSIKSI